MSYSEAERCVIEATREGLEARFTSGEIISADLIRKLMLGVPLYTDLAPVPTPCGVRIIGAVIDGAINLNNGRGDNGTVMPGLVLDYCRIIGGIDISYAQLGKLSLEHTAVGEIRAVRAFIEGELIANDIHPAEEFGNCFLSAHSLHVDGDIQLRRAMLRESSEPDQFGTEQFALDLRNATINGTVYLRDLVCHGTINISLARITGNFTARSGQIVPRIERVEAIIARDVAVEGAVTLRKSPFNGNAFIAYGQIVLTRAHMAAGVFDGAIIAPKSLIEPSLDLHGANVKGGLYFREGFFTKGKVNLDGATVESDIIAKNAWFGMGLSAVALHAQRMFELVNIDTDGEGIHLEDAVVDVMIHISGVRAALNFKRARTRTLSDGGAVMGRYDIFLDGLHYERLEDLGDREDKDRLKPERIYQYRMRWFASQGLGFRFTETNYSRLIEKVTGAPCARVDEMYYRPQRF